MGPPPRRRPPGAGRGAQARDEARARYEWPRESDFGKSEREDLGGTAEPLI